MDSHTDGPGIIIGQGDYMENQDDQDFGLRLDVLVSLLALLVAAAFAWMLNQWMFG